MYLEELDKKITVTASHNNCCIFFPQTTETEGRSVVTAHLCIVFVYVYVSCYCLILFAERKSRGRGRRTRQAGEKTEGEDLKVKLPADIFTSCLWSSVMGWQLLPTQASSSANIWASQTSLAC